MQSALLSLQQAKEGWALAKLGQAGAEGGSPAGAEAVRACGMVRATSLSSACSAPDSIRVRVHQVLKEEILPALERLRREKGQFLEWQAANANIDRLRRFCVAYRVVETERCAAAPVALLLA